MKKVIATIWVDRTDAPSFILEDGSIMRPTWGQLAGGWTVGWSLSKELTATVEDWIMVGGDHGYNVTVFENGEKVTKFTTVA